MEGTRPRTHGYLPRAAGFVGRERELTMIAGLLLDRVRFVTLVGPGGIGKTCLAEAASRRLRQSTGASIHWVRLARLGRNADVGMVEEEVAQAVVEIDFSHRSAWDVLVDTLARTDSTSGAMRTVLVMDNCEHVVAAAGQVIANLLESVPGLTILATSREAVGWVDERLVVVPPLSRAQAAALFRQRAAAVGMPIGEDAADNVADICRRVDCHPLYLRLAAARLRYQPLTGVLQELSGTSDDRRMRWSHGPQVGADARHRAMRDVIYWSYELCGEQERILLQRMSVFAAGYETNPEDDHGDQDVGVELAAIEEICADPSGGDEGPARLLRHDDIEQLLTRLVDRSLVTAHITAHTVRYSLLESIRVFARERLDERALAEWSPLQRRHLIHFRNMVVLAQTNWLSPAEQETLDWARAAWDNIRVAIETSLATATDAALGMEIAAGLIALRAPMFRGSLREVRQWIQRTLDHARETTPETDLRHLLAQALLCWVALCQGGRADAEQALKACLAMSVADSATLDWRRDCGLHVKALPPVDFVWGVALMMIDRDPRAIEVLGRAREKYQHVDRTGPVAVTELFEALAAGLLGSVEQAVGISKRHLDRVTAAGAESAIAWAKLAWAVALTRQGNTASALVIGREALACQLDIRDQWGALWAIHVRIWSLARVVRDLTVAGDPAVAASSTEIAYLVGGTRTLRASIGVEIIGLGPFADATDDAIDVARRALGQDRFESAVRRGERLRPESQEVQSLALGVLNLDQVGGRRAEQLTERTPWDTLTAAEQEVAVLAAAGYANTGIAARRGKSFKTVDAQMTTIFQKLLITSRDEIISFLPAAQLQRARAEAADRPARRAGGTGRKRGSQRTG
ncbi:helix-turn-helix transcriptional regulator [Nocardia brasiliensis]|uniref:helix-turn-helix transcriptional regulator n=1 Tax=Nocardia brasiliensis TaxID=37326 RepID=UPI00245402DA|nr:LuxR C-terminal-related transcriptional regulator [Nocardia brasiliensis]